MNAGSPFWSSPRIAPPPVVDRLLALCAYPRVSAAIEASIQREARVYSEWASFVSRAEAHGIAPLAQWHIEAASADAPRDVRRDLTALKIRHTQASKLRAALVGEIGGSLEARGLPALFLKGVALSHLVYPEPRLREMRDMDVLVVPEQLADAGEVLRKLGFAAPNEATWAIDKPHYHHPDSRTRIVDGYTFSVEVHRRLNIRRRGARRWIEQLLPEATEVRVGGTAIRTLGPTDMLYHVHYHGFGAPLGWADRLRLISASDVFGIVDTWRDRIDWARLAKIAPRTCEALPWFDAMVAGSSGLEVRGHDYRGYPREDLAERRRDPHRYLADTFMPPEWWLRLRYGGPAGARGLTIAWMRHMKDVWRPGWVGGDWFIGTEKNRPRS